MVKRMYLYDLFLEDFSGEAATGAACKVGTMSATMLQLAASNQPRPPDRQTAYRLWATGYKNILNLVDGGKQHDTLRHGHTPH